MISIKTIGIVLIILSVLLLVIGYAYVRSAENSLLEGHSIGSNGACVHAQGLQCPYRELNLMMWPKIIGAILDFILLCLGIWFFFQKKPEQEFAEKTKKSAMNLSGDEALIFNLLMTSEGIVYQNEIVEKTGLSKVKVTRVLDRLEGKRLIERRRRGMTNVVIVK